MSGIIGVTRGGSDLVSPPSTPSGDTWRYQLALPFQVAPRKAAVFCNIRKGLVPYMDFEVGVDVILFDDLATVSADHAVLLSRSHEGQNPNTAPPGVRAFMSKYPARGGFVPLGAERVDGSPHPHAGTGFAILDVVAKNTDAPFDRKNIGGYFLGLESYAYTELHQLAYDGTNFQVVSTEHVEHTELLPGWNITNGAITNAIPDGDCFLVGITGGKIDDDAGSGVMRWQRKGSSWHPVSLVIVTDGDGSVEPSLIRDVDGTLLFSARGGAEPSDIRVWRSEDGGETWNKAIQVRGVVSDLPISINQAADGTPYIAANIKGWARDLLSIWPVNEERTGLETPIIVRFGLLEFGPPPQGERWEIDHPSAMTVQLADGEWHNVLGYRLMQRAEKEYGAAPTLHSGAYLEEVISDGKAIPIWSF